METEETNQGRDEEAKAKEQGEGLGPKSTPPGQELPGPAEPKEPGPEDEPAPPEPGA